jgi:hypothetical protein
MRLVIYHYHILFWIVCKFVFYLKSKRHNHDDVVKIYVTILFIFPYNLSLIAHYKLTACIYTSKVASFLGKAYTTGYGCTEGTPTILIPGVENLRYHITGRGTVEVLIKNKLPGIQMAFMSRTIFSSFVNFAASVCLSIYKPFRTAERLFPKIYFWSSTIICDTFPFLLKSDNNNGYLTQDLHVFLTWPRT